jgi:hypothetical protein
MALHDATLHARTLCIHNIACQQSVPEDNVGLPGSILRYVMAKREHRKIAISHDAYTPQGLRQQHLAITYDDIKLAQNALFDMRAVCKELYPDQHSRPMVSTRDRLNLPAFACYVRYQDTSNFTPPRQEALCALAQRYGKLHRYTPSRFHGYDSTCFSAFVNFEAYQSALDFVAAGERGALEIEGHQLCVSAQSSTEWLTAMRERLGTLPQFSFDEAMCAARVEPCLLLRDDARAVLAAWFGPPKQGRFKTPVDTAPRAAALCMTQHAPSLPARLLAPPLHCVKPVEEHGLVPTVQSENAARTIAVRAETAVLQPLGPDKDTLGEDATQSLWSLQHAELVAFFHRHCLPTAGLEEAGLTGGDLRGIVYGTASSVFDTFLPVPPRGLGFVHRLKYTVVFANAVHEEFGIALPPLDMPVPCENETVIESGLECDCKGDT